MISWIYQEYVLFFFYILLVCLLAFLLLFLVKLFSDVSIKLFFKEKFSPYECGFMPYDDARNKYEIHFYLIALLFVIFDVEIILLLPWVVFAKASSSFGACIMALFLFILGLGFLYEWKVGALDWFIKK